MSTPIIAPNVQTQSTDPSMPAVTTFQEDLVAAGQRRVNLVWEYTQSAIAVIVVLSNMIVAVYDGIVGRGLNDFPVILSSSLFLIVGFYFSRTNHSAIGGVGKKPVESYTGR
jgi:hypothetical protein